MIRRRKKTGSILGSIAGAIINLLAKSSKTPPENMKNVDFPSSSQKIGVRFTKKIRDRFRNKWLKKR